MKYAVNMVREIQAEYYCKILFSKYSADKFTAVDSSLASECRIVCWRTVVLQNS